MTLTNLNRILKAMENSLYQSAVRHHLLTYSEDEDLKVYLEFSEMSYTRVSDGMFEKLNKAVKQCNSTGIKYLLMTKQLGVTRFREDQRSLNRKVYLKLIREFGNIPLSCRKAVARALKLNKAANHKDAMKVLRTWSKTYRETELDIMFDLHSTAAGLIDENETEASAVYYQSFQKALHQSDPLLCLTNLNNAVVCLMRRDLNKAVALSKELSFYIGVYGEVHQSVLIIAGTLMQVARLTRDYDAFFEAARLTAYYYERVVKADPPLKNLYRPLIRMAGKEALIKKKKTLREDELPNTKGLRDFLKGKIGRVNSFIEQHHLPHTTVYRVLNGESPVVRIKTLKTFIRALELGPSFDNPKAINYVLWITRIEAAFEKNVEKIVKVPDDGLVNLLIRGIFIALPDESLDYHKLFLLVKDREKLLDYLKNDISRMAFINNCFETGYGYYRGRGELFDTLMGQMVKCEKNEFAALYLSLKTTEEIQRLSEYFRTYSRLSTVTTDSNVTAVLQNRFLDPDYKKIASFCHGMALEELKGYLCTWYLEGAERDKLIAYLVL